MQSLELNIVRGPGQGKAVTLPADRAFTIGRGHSNDLTLQDRLVSSHHARITPEGGYFVLTDLNSKNHTFVNGVAITGAVVLRNDDQLGIGNSLVVVRETAATSVEYSDRPDTGPVRAAIETVKTVSIDPSAIRTAITGFGRAEKNLAVVYAAGRVLGEHREPAEFLPRLLDLMFDVVPAERGAVFILDRGEMRPLHARDARGSTLANLSISRSVLRKSVDDGVSVLTGAGFAGDDGAVQESIVLHQISSAMCAPIRGRTKSLGAIYLDSKITGRSFEQEDLELLTTVATQAGLAHENSHLATESAKAERMAAIGLVVAGLAHDIKNYFAGITLAEELVEPEVKAKLSEDGLQAWAAMKDSQRKISDLVQDMLAYSKPRDPEWQLVDPNEVVAAAAKALGRLAESRGVLLDAKRHPRAGLWWMDPRTMERSLVNLATNGIDATPGGGTVSLKVAPAEDGRSLEIHVSDTGAGIPPEARDKVFDFFFSTKSSKGTGLGLAVTRKVVEEHGGTITFTTEVNEGTSFLVRIPKYDERPATRLQTA
ncbi:MAG: FHA domain-containing protein [Planctomycetaceae bacterium]|nr:ATP-binding protein [Planctomycetota bacterium]NUN51859.1 FHA domain-containing protein [Planctomycetaceae bacterium]